MIKLYPSTETAFASNGIGALSDAISCTVTEERNGAYELTMQYPVSGIHFDSLALRALILAKPSPTGGPQPFRIYRMTRPLGGVVTVYAAHISYDLSGVPLQPFTAGSVQAALVGLQTNAVAASPFTFWSDMTNAGDFAVAAPISSRAALGGQQGSILDVYGGEYEFDRYTVRLWSERGVNRGVSIRYGKNLTSLEQDENCSNVYTGVYPYYVPSEGAIVQLPERVVKAPGTYDFERVLPLDLSGEFEDAPSEAQLRAAAEAYIENNRIGVPAVSLKLSFVQLEQTEEYKHLALLERVSLCDTVNVEFAAMGVSATAKCVKTVYNALLGLYDSVELGDARTNIADTIAGQQAAIKAASEQVGSALTAAIANATALITGNKGGYVVLHSSTGGQQPDEILIMDAPDIETAVNVWRWNKSGLGYSSTGYNGPYGTAITQDGAIVADFITTGSMDAARVTTGLLTSKDGRVQFDLTAGTLTIKDSSGNIKLGFDAAGNLTISGTVYATGGSFTGNVYASGGTIGGFTISGGSLTSTGLTVNPDGTVQFGSYGQVRSFANYNGAICLQGSSAGFIVGNRYVMYNGSTLNVLGDLEVSGANVWMGSLTSRSVTYDANLRLDTDSGYLYRITSSRRYKKDIHDVREYDDVSARIDRVRAVTFTGRGTKDAGRYGYGFVAEEMEQEFPWLTEYTTDETGTIQAESVSYSRVPAVLWADAQATHERLAALERRLAELEAT